MSKIGQGMGAGAMPPPQPSGIGTVQPNGLMAGLQNLFPDQGSKARYDMVMNLVQAGMRSAQASGSPIASFLAPIAGAMIGGRATKKYNDNRTKSASEMASSFFGPAINDPQAQSYIGILNDPNAPAYLRSAAQTKLNAFLKPKRSALAKKQRPASNTDMLIARMLQSSMDPNSDGGANISPAEQARLDVVKSARSRSSRAASGNLSIADELTSLAGGNTTGQKLPLPAQGNGLGLTKRPPA